MSFAGEKKWLLRSFMKWFQDKNVSGDQYRMCMDVFDPCCISRTTATTHGVVFYGCFNNVFLAVVISH